MPELITKAWKCSYCSRCFVNKGVATNHESACKRNPERQHCATCIYGIELREPRELKETLTIETYFCGIGSNIQREPQTYCGPWCAYHEAPMTERPYYIECDTDDNPYYEEQPMPGTCWNYKYKGRFGWTPEAEYRAAVERGEIEVKWND